LETPYLVKAPLDFSFEEVTDENRDKFTLEFDSLSEVEIDPIGHWLKLKKAKGETEDSDEVLLELIMELHRKIDKLERVIKGTEIEKRTLQNIGIVESIGFHNFQTKEPLFVIDKYYFGKIELKSYPQRDVPIFFRAVSTEMAKIDRIHLRDESDWGSYFRARERVMIRENRRL